MININCKNCYNPFGTLKNKTLELDYKRVNNIKHDFESNSSTVKCRKCSTVSILKFEDGFSNEINQKLSSRELLG